MFTVVGSGVISDSLQCDIRDRPSRFLGTGQPYTIMVRLRLLM